MADVDRWEEEKDVVVEVEVSTEVETESLFKSEP